MANALGDEFDDILEVALQLAVAQPGQAMYERILDGVVQMVGPEAVALLRYDGKVLRPLAVRGLSSQVLAQHFDPAVHPRLRALLSSPGVLRFAPNDPRPDPYDGLLACATDGYSRVHACMGAPLRVEGELVGLLTADARDPTAFDENSQARLARFAALAAAAMRISALFEGLQGELERKTQLARDLVRDAMRRQGGELLGRSLPMQQLRREVATVARSGVPVLILGETGTGKELVARALHAQSPRSDEPLIHVNCAALPESLAESELFGHVKGAFTGAIGARTGKFELAHRGTLFLDEVGELPLSLQPKLLRALQEGELQRVGADAPLRVDVRVLAATNRDLVMEVEAGRFRADLYHRLAVYPLLVPPLRVRGDDVHLLAGHFLQESARQLGLRRAVLAQDALNALGRYSWPGNVRELQHVILRAALRAAQDATGSDNITLKSEHLGLAPAGESRGSMVAQSASFAQDAARATSAGSVPAAVGAWVDLTLPEALVAFERDFVQYAVEQSGGNWAEAARRLGLDRSNLHRLGRRLGLK